MESVLNDNDDLWSDSVVLFTLDLVVDDGLEDGLDELLELLLLPLLPLLPLELLPLLPLELLLLPLEELLLGIIIIINLIILSRLKMSAHRILTTAQPTTEHLD